MINKDFPRHRNGATYLKTSKALYLFKYFMFRLYARKYSDGFFTEKVFFPISLTTSGASWNIGSKTRRLLDPSSFFSKPMIVMEWPLIVSKDQSECIVIIPGCWKYIEGSCVVRILDVLSTQPARKYSSTFFISISSAPSLPSVLNAWASQLLNGEY